MAGLCLWFCVKLVSTIGTAIRIFEPFFDAMVAKDMAAFRQAEGGFVNALGSFNTVIIITNDAT